MSLLYKLGTNLLRRVTLRSINVLNGSDVGKNHNDAKNRTEGEIHLENLLKKSFPNADSVQVNDISGGCGSMYEVHIKSEDFIGKRIIQQHKLVTNALKDEVVKMHGLRIFTSVPS